MRATKKDVSLCTSPGSGHHFETGAHVARLLVSQLLRKPLEHDRALILNVNVPDVTDVDVPRLITAISGDVVPVPEYA